MPIFQWRCDACGYTAEHLMSYERSKNVEVVCEPCSLAMRKLVSMPAKTPTLWNAGWTEGLSSNMYSHALGRQVANKREEERIMNANGFVNEKDLGDGWFENAQSKIIEKRKEQDRRSAIYQKTLEETGDANKAVETAFPAKDCLDGTLDALYDESIDY